MLGTRRGYVSSPLGREVILLCDQLYPPILPSNLEWSCIRIIRLEFGNIHELVTILGDLLRERTLASGSIILIFMATHLANVGRASYIEDLVAANKCILGTLGSGCYFSAAPPMLLGCTGNSDLIVSISALTAWINTSVGEDSTFSGSSKVTIDTILENGGSGGQYSSCTRVRLPLSLSSHDNKKIWVVGGDPSLPNTTDLVSIEQETKIITALIAELQLNHALELDNHTVVNRDLGSRGEAGAASYLIVLNSNAKKLEEALKAKGISTGAVLANNWRATKKSAEDMASHVKTALAEGSYSAVVFQLLDNNMFFSIFEDGSLCPARSAIDGQYHIDGELVIASQDCQFAILKLCAPLWEAAKGLRMVVVGRMSRYISAGCCPEPDHITNRNNPEFYQKMKEGLPTCCTVIKDFLFTSGLHGLTAAEIWGSDPIHPKKEIYGLLADSVIEVERSCSNGKQKTSSNLRKDRGGSCSRVLLSHRRVQDNRGGRYQSLGGGSSGRGLRGRGGGQTGGGGHRSWKRGGGGSWRSHHRGAGVSRGVWSGPF